jgi:hypothetical protein
MHARGIKSVPEDAVKLVNFIKARPVNIRISENLPRKWAAYNTVWLTPKLVGFHKVKSLDVCLSFRMKYLFLLATHPSHKASCMQNPVWLLTFPHLADIFSKLNNLNLSLQASNTAAFNVQLQLNLSYKNWDYVKICLDSNQPEYFDTSHHFLMENFHRLGENVKAKITENLG